MAAVANVHPIDAPLALWQICDHLAAMYELRDEMQGLPEGERAILEQEIAAFEEAEILKCDGITRFLSHCESQQEFAAAEIKRLQSRKQLWAARQERLEAHIARVMECAGKSKLEGKVSTLTLKRCPPSVEVVDQTSVPDSYIRVKVEESVDKAQAKKDLLAGIEIEGLRLVTDKRTVVRS